MICQTVTASGPTALDTALNSAIKRMSAQGYKIEVQFSTAIAQSNYGTVQRYSALLIGRQ